MRRRVRTGAPLLASALLIFCALGTSATGQQPVTSVGNPSWSPDGRWIAFNGNRYGEPGVYLSTPDGSVRRRVPIPGLRPRWPSWSPDGKYLAFAAVPPGSDSTDLFIARADGSGLQRVTHDKMYGGLSAWSPDGKRLAFYSRKGGRWNVYTVDRDGTNLRRVTDDRGDHHVPSWSPDGKRLLMTANRDGAMDIWILAEANGAMTRVFHSDSGADVARWSPDGEWISFGAKVGGAFQLHLMKADGSGVRQITRGETFATTSSWSPDGQRLAYECRENSVFHICVINRDGAGRRIITPLPTGSFSDSTPGGQEQARPEEIAFRNVTVVDVERGGLIEGVTVRVRGNRIAAIDRGTSGRDALDSTSSRSPSRARVIDARGMFLIPGLWDMHAHATAPRWRAFLPVLVAHGVTGIREMFSRNAWIDESRVAIARGTLIGPRIVGSGHILDGSGSVWPNAVRAVTPPEARRAVDSLRTAGADLIKVYNRLPRDAYFAAVAEATRLGVPVDGHVPLLVGADEASNAGQRTIEHLTNVVNSCSPRAAALRAEVAAAAASGGAWDSAATVTVAQWSALAQSVDPAQCGALAATFARNRTWMVPTFVMLAASARLADSSLTTDPRLRLIPMQARNAWASLSDSARRSAAAVADQAVRRAFFSKQLEVVPFLHRVGVQFLAGTDLANPYVFPGGSLHDELARFVEVGFTPLEALRTATINPAIALGLADSLGSVAVGKRADLVLLRANPLLDIDNVRLVEAVVADGVLIDRELRTRLITTAEREASRPPGP